MKLPHGWRQPIHIADAGGRGPVDSSAAFSGTGERQLSGKLIAESQLPVSPARAGVVGLSRVNKFTNGALFSHET